MFDFLKRKKKTVRHPMMEEKLTKENLDKFLNNITKEIDLSFSGQESNTLEQLVQHEFDLWVKNTIEKDHDLDMTSVRVGVCLGLRESLRKINEAEEDKHTPSYVT